MVTMNRKSCSCFRDVTKKNMWSNDTYVCNIRDMKSCHRIWQKIHHMERRCNVDKMLRKKRYYTFGKKTKLYFHLHLCLHLFNLQGCKTLARISIRTKKKHIKFNKEYCAKCLFDQNPLVSRILSPRKMSPRKTVTHGTFCM